MDPNCFSILANSASEFGRFLHELARWSLIVASVSFDLRGDLFIE
jgi:hypothetical protein